ncbi:Ig-like domain-containing protein [Flavobacteriaceae bacterium XHP0103]|uniref:Ig-like domain-containing protein n=1 Tax=Marixanthotalea marina TaxID=2844359 RepID=UPI002989DB8D|nr:Ig-like domain-containing protein [Marixanthotalea marina]MBU3822235.1 Ig-like domain-containing protein [Marixanthotalea marina]
MKSLIYSIKKIRFYLVFFYAIFSFSCKQNTENKTIVKFEITDTESVSFNSDTSLLDDLTVVLAEHPDTPIIGDWLPDGKHFTFTPLLPFTADKIYEIRDEENTIYRFSVKPKNSETYTEIEAIYPTTDSVPENLLKMYLVFSNPMQEVGNALDYITVTDNTINKEVDVFLELQSELWNKEHTVLTLWLDPGRVKTDLIPNQKMGLPIQKGHEYTIEIHSDWKDANGQPLTKSYYKKLIVTNRDNEMPKTDLWSISVPKPNTKEPLNIDFKEPMDYFLVMECFVIQDSSNNSIKGTFTVSNKETKLQFKPEMNWEKGDYSIVIESRLEDLAGNNLNHLFDTDLKTNNTTIQTGTYKSATFRVQ